MQNLLHIVGARPNFMKIAPVMKAFERTGEVRQMLVHTGQHYDDELSKYFFEDLGLPKPDVDLGDRHRVAAGRHRDRQRHRVAWRSRHPCTAPPSARCPFRHRVSTRWCRPPPRC